MKKVILVLFAFVIVLFLTSCGNSGIKNNDKKVSPDSVKFTSIKPTVNVYIENSISMDGFVNKGNDFTTFVSTFLTDISISFTDSINLNYINSNIISLDKDINDFTSKLDASSFKNGGGKRGETHIFQLLDTILKLTDDNKIAIFITDGIFSPGSQDAQKYIGDQFNGIKKSMAEYYQKHSNTAVIIYQLISQFDGDFYDRHNKKIPKTIEELPYYVWLIGNSKNLKELIDKVPESKFKGSGVQNIFSITGGPKPIDYAVKMGSGNFDLDKKETKTTIVNLKNENRSGCNRSSNSVKFSVNANLSGFLLPDSYLNDVSNYELSNQNYSLNITKAIPNSFGYTQQLNFTSDKVHKGTITIKLKIENPPWVEEVNDSIGLQPLKGKTYGIKYQIDGVYKAFTIENNYYTEIKIKII